MSVEARLAPLLAHPAIWRGRSARCLDTVPTGFAALDASLPGKGWPQVGLIEILLPRLGVGEMYLLLPALAALTSRPTARWCAWIAPPLDPFAPALAAHGLDLSRLLVVHTPTPLWACEQALRSGACEVALGWVRRVQSRALRRLQLATEHGRTLGVLFRALTPRSKRESSCAAVRIALSPIEAGLRITLLKSRGGPQGAIEVHFPVAVGS
ncbi:MAG TPA: translesion DNA synthesis-associated protein ImuA [Steroidobacteraceae bacterium]|nr:translesion DNA synthesis-associated protein ImuA [Steroidobacteraceae bacterium]